MPNTAPLIILVRPQLGENIGAAARAMLNCGLTQLRLVAPRDGWPSASAQAASAGADEVLASAQIYPDLPSAIADCELVLATAGRSYALNKPLVTLEQGCALLQTPRKTAVLFGPERTGLEADDLHAVHSIITIPLNPAFNSLNLAQAVLLVAYGWYQTKGLPVLDDSHRTHKTRPATAAEFAGLMEHLTTELDASGFFTSAQKRPSMLRNLAAAFSRMQPTEQDVLTLRGVIKALAKGRRNP